MISVKHDLSQVAVMDMEKGEELLGGWVTPSIPQVGMYKLLAKKKADGTVEWVHFVQRDNGLREKVMRGVVKNAEECAVVKDAVDRNLRGVFGVTLQAAEYDVRPPDGRTAPGAKH